MACIPSVSVWRCLLHSSYPNKVSFHTSRLAVAASVRDAIRRCYSVSLHQRVGTFVRDWEVRRHFLWLVSSCHFPPFPVTFLLRFSGFKRFFYIGNISFYPQRVFWRSLPSVWAVLLLPLHCCWHSLTQKSSYNEVYSSLVFLPLHFEAVGKFCFTKIKKKFDHILS